MPTIVFQPGDRRVEVDANTKVLVAATRQKIPIRFGCAACRCGTCAVKITGAGALTPVKPEEQALLKRIGLASDGTIRLACQARLVEGEIAVDIAFQDSYSPDEEGDESL